MAHVTRDADAAFAVTTAVLFTWYHFLTGKGKMVGGDLRMPCVTSWGKRKSRMKLVRLEGSGFGLILGSFRS